MMEKRKSNYGFWYPTITTGGKKQESFTLKRLLSCGVSYFAKLKIICAKPFWLSSSKRTKGRRA